MFGTDNLESIKDASDQVIRLRYEVFYCCHRSMQTARVDESPDEEPVVKLVLSRNGVVDVNLLRLPEYRGEFWRDN